MAVIRVTLSLDEEVVRAVDEYADVNQLSRSSCVNRACKQFLEAEDMRPAIGELLKQFVGITINKAGLNDEEQLQAMEEVEEKLQRLTG